jgi:hypothetical protein
MAHANFSNFKVQRSRLSKRSLAAEAEIFSAFEFFGGDDLERDLGTEVNQHLRPRRNMKQVWKSAGVWTRGRRIDLTSWTGEVARPHMGIHPKRD